MCLCREGVIFMSSKKRKRKRGSSLVVHAPGMPGTFPRHRLLRKPLVSDPDIHHGTCVTHVPWCMSGSVSRGGGENVPGTPGACATLDCTYLARGPWSKKSTKLTTSLICKLKYSSKVRKNYPARHPHDNDYNMTLLHIWGSSRPLWNVRIIFGAIPQKS